MKIIEADRIKYVSSQLRPELAEFIRSLGYELRIVMPAPEVAAPIAAHPDIQLCRLGIADTAPVAVAESGELAIRYPCDIPFNAACTGKFFVHNTKYTNGSLLQAVREQRLRIIDVKQGYTKCSCVVVDESSIITYDEGIAARCRDVEGLSVLLVRPGYVKLEGYSTGFIGGCSGRVGNTIVFNGDIDGHPDGARIRHYIEERGLSCVGQPWPLEDIGSII